MLKINSFHFNYVVVREIHIYPTKWNTDTKTGCQSESKMPARWGRWRNLKWKFSNWNSNFGFKCLSGGSVWILSLKCKPFRLQSCILRDEKFTYFDFQHINLLLFSQNVRIGNAFIQQAGIHYSCLYMFIGLIGLVLFWYRGFQWFTPQLTEIEQFWCLFNGHTLTKSKEA